jgi:hypothetical protein
MPNASQQSPRLKQSHIFPADAFGHFVEPEWCSRRLFEVESFDRTIWDPCCGWGRVMQAAIDAGYHTFGSDIVDRGAHSKLSGHFMWFLGDFLGDFLCDTPIVPPPFSIVGNPPFDKLQEFVERALALGAGKVAFIWRLQRLAAAKRLRDVPLARIYLLTPRPSMPPGSFIEAGGKVSGDSHDYCWLIFTPGYTGAPRVHWLLRDGGENE